MINKSLWLKGVKNTKSNNLKEGIKTDILIIGGGITGITTAYFLTNKKLDVTVVDQNKIGQGHTSMSTGKLTYLQGNIYNDIEKIYDKKKAKLYLQSQKDAIEIVKSNIIDNNIKCNYESNNSFVFTNKLLSKYKINRLEKIIEKNYKLVKSLPIKYPCIYAIKTSDTAVFNPYKYVNELKQICIDNKINIYENTKIVKLEKEKDHYIAYTNKNKIEAKKVVLACHYPFFIIPYFLPFKTKIKKAYLCAGITDKNKRFNAISEDDNIHSIRYYTDNKDYLIYAGEEKDLSSNIDNEANYKKILWHVKFLLNNNIKYMWFNYDLVTNDHLPFIGKLKKNDDMLLIGTGYNLWGMTNGTIAGKILSDIILNNKNKYIELFNPNRNFNINKLTNYLTYNTKNGYSYILSKLKKEYPFYKNVKVIQIDNVKYGVYIDENKKEHIVYNLCPHMKCNLIFNTIDKTWDCPCHGSRFNIDGKAITGPSIYNISIEKK